MAESSVVPVSLTYEKGDGQAIGGFLYEIGLYNLVMLRCLKKEQKFYLAANYSEVKGFDDVVARIQTDVNKSAAIFLQAKHMKPNKKLYVEEFARPTREEKTKLKEIKILNYFTAYKDCELKFKPDATSPMFRTSSDENIDKIFVHYTNLDIDESMSQYFEIVDPGDLELLVLTGKQPTARVFKLNMKGQNAIKIKTGEDKMLENFCANFRLAVCQALESEIKDSLIDDLPCIVADDYKKDLLRQLLEESNNLWQKSKGFFETDEKNTVHDIMMRQYFIEHQQNPLYEKLVYKEDAVNTFHDEIKDINFVSVQASSQEKYVYLPLISQAAKAIAQAAQSTAQTTEANAQVTAQAAEANAPAAPATEQTADSIAPAAGVAKASGEKVIVVVDTKTCNTMWHIIKNKIESSITFLVITCNELELAINLIIKLSSLKMHKESKIIFLHSGKANSIFDVLKAKENIRYADWKCVLQFSWLTKECQSRVLDKIVHFQGKDETIRDVLGTSIQIIDINFLSCILAVDKMVIGRKIEGLGPISEYYISRDFELNEEKTQKKSKNITTSELLKQRINQKGKKKSKFTVIYGEAGTGKSTELKKMSEILQHDGRKFWVVLVILNDMYDEFKQTKKFDVDLALQLLSKHIQKDFGSSLFNSFCLGTEKVVLLLDGFDEIEAKYRDSLESFISALRDTKINQVIVTTRPHISPNLEGVANQQELKLSRFSNNNVDNFFQTYFKKVIKENKLEITEDVDKKIADFVCAVKKSFHNNTIIDIPLQARMIAEINKKSLLEYLPHDSNHHIPLEKLISKSSNIKELYDEFFEGKLQIYLREKLYLVERQSDRIWRTESHAILSFHMKYATEHIFPDTIEPKIFDIVSLNVEGTECDESFGIIEKLENKKAKFLHKTFAEYFSSRLITLRMRSEKEDGCLFKFVLRSVMVSDDFKVVREFLNYMDLQISNGTESHLGRSITEVCKSQENKSIVLHLLLEEKLFNIFFFLMKSLKSKSIEANDVREILELKNSDENPCLFYAARSSLDATLELLEYNVDVNVTVNYGMLLVTTDVKGPVIHVARDCEVLKLLIDNGANVNALDDENMTALESFTQNGNYEMVKYLVTNHYCSLTTPSEDIGKALIVAVQLNYLKIAKMLVTDGNADVHVKSEDMGSLLHIAANEGHLEIVSWLVEEKKADINARARFGRTPLHRACWEGKLDVVHFLSDKVEDVNIRDNFDSWTPLHYAATKNNVEVIETLVKYGANVDACDTKGLTALHIAAQYWQLNVVKYLVETCKAGINTSCDNGNTPLHTMLKWREDYTNRQVTRLDVVQYLVKAGANVTYFNNEGQTPLDLAECLVKKRDKIVDYLKGVVATQ